MKVFVAGATGVLGRALVPQLVARGHEVVGMTRSASKRDLVRSLGARPGGAIMIHGLAKPFAYLGPLHRQTDWTDGCIAVTNAEIEEIWKLVRVGTRVEIRP